MTHRSVSKGASAAEEFGRRNAWIQVTYRVSLLTGAQ
jgi:hypothetical protein